MITFIEYIEQLWYEYETGKKIPKKTYTDKERRKELNKKWYNDPSNKDRITEYRERDKEAKRKKRKGIK